MPLILSLETATRRCAVVLAEGTAVLACREEESERLTHAERLNVFIDEVMTEAGRGFSELSAVAVGIGPGSYTGLRIGLSAAKGMCYALGIPLIGMGTLDVLVRELLASGTELPPGAVLMPMVDARRMEVFTLEARADGMHVREAHPLVLDDAWSSTLVSDRVVVAFGDGADKAGGLLRGLSAVRHVEGVRTAHRGMAMLAAELYAAERFSDLAYLVPDYGKPANVTRPRGSAA